MLSIALAACDLADIFPRCFACVVSLLIQPQDIALPLLSIARVSILSLPQSHLHNYLYNWY